MSLDHRDLVAERRRVRAWLVMSIRELRVAHERGDERAVADAIAHYVERGRRIQQSPLTMWDRLCISTPGVLDRAGFEPEEAERFVPVFEEVCREAKARHVVH